MNSELSELLENPFIWNKTTYHIITTINKRGDFFRTAEDFRKLFKNSYGFRIVIFTTMPLKFNKFYKFDIFLVCFMK